MSDLKDWKHNPFRHLKIADNVFVKSTCPCGRRNNKACSFGQLCYVCCQTQVAKLGQQCKAHKAKAAEGDAGITDATLMYITVSVAAAAKARAEAKAKAEGDAEAAKILAEAKAFTEAKALAEA